MTRQKPKTSFWQKLLIPLVSVTLFMALFEGALAILDAALAIDPRLAELHFGRGEALFAVENRRDPISFGSAP